MTNLMPLSSRCLWMTSAMSLSAMRGMTWSIISMTVTSFPISRNATASSRPMTPAPPMTTFLASARAAWMSFPSLTVLTTKTLPRSVPSTGGTKTRPPVAMTRESYPYVFPAAVTVLASPSTDSTLVLVRTLIPRSFS